MGIRDGRPRHFSVQRIILKWLQQPGPGKVQAGSKNSILVSHIGGKGLGTCVLSLLSQVHYQGPG